MVVVTATMCLALNVFHEARNQLIPGQYAVALVTRNRARKSGDTICEEVFKPKQFSWTDRVRRVQGGWAIPASLQPREVDAWRLAYRIAQVTLQGSMADITQGATFYHTTAVAPSWRLAMGKRRTIGDHVFYVARQSGVTRSL